MPLYRFIHKKISPLYLIKYRRSSSSAGFITAQTLSHKCRSRDLHSCRLLQSYTDSAPIGPRINVHHTNESNVKIDLFIDPRRSLHNHIQSLISDGKLDEASGAARRSVFCNIYPYVCTCNEIMRAMFEAECFDDAIELFEFFYKKSKIAPDIVSYELLVKSLCGAGRPIEGLGVYRRHIRAHLSFSPSVDIYRSLSKSLVYAGKFSEAADLFGETCKGHDARRDMYINLIAGFLRYDNLEEAYKHFNEFHDEFGYNEKDGVVYAEFMDCFFRHARGTEAMLFYRRFLDQPFRLSPAIGNIFLEVFLKHGESGEAWTLFDKMFDNHTPPEFIGVNPNTFNIMANECFKLGKFLEAIDVFKRSQKVHLAMDVAGYNAIISRLCEEGILSEAEKLFQDLLSGAGSSYLTPDVTSYEILIDYYLRQEMMDHALGLFYRMVVAGLRVNKSFGARVFDNLVNHDMVLESAQMLTKMVEGAHKPDVIFYEVVIKALHSTEGLPNVRSKLTNDMDKYGVQISEAIEPYI